jgi:uncharacterized protein YjiS (DUF1127 family)
MEANMSATMVTITALATGLASVGALLAYPLASTQAGGIAEVMPRVERTSRLGWFARLREWSRQQRKVAELSDLDDRMLRDIGITRGILLSENFRISPRRSSRSEFDMPQLRSH